MKNHNLLLENPILKDQDPHEYGLGEKIFALGQVLAYMSLSASLVLMFVHAKKTEIVPEISRNHPSKSMADKLMFGQFIFLQASLICKLICMCILVFVINGYITNGDYPEAVGKIFYCTSWSLLYLAFNCDLYKWVFAVHRINLYGGKISVAQFHHRQTVSYYIYAIFAGLLVLTNFVVTCFSAFMPTNTKSILFQSLIIFDFGSLFVVFSVIGSLLIFYLPYYFGTNYQK